jgi:hypothetical protein
MAIFSFYTGIGVLLSLILTFGLVLGLVKGQGTWFYILFSLLLFVSLAGVSSMTEELGNFLWGVKGALVLPQSFLNILPVSIFLYGPVSDLIHNEVVSGIPAYTSFFFLLLIRIISIFFTRNLPTDSGTGQDIWCTLPGFEWLENPFFPSSVFTTIAISTYYMCWTIFTDSDKKSIILSGGFTAIALSLAQYAFGNCSSFYVPLGGQGMWANLLLSMFLGTIIGTALYSAYWSDGSKNPFWGNPQSKNGSATKNNNPISTSNLVSEVPNTSSAPSGDEQTFVAELYKNGQLVAENISK